MQNYNSCRGYKMTDIAVTKQPKKKFRHETTENAGTNDRKLQLRNGKGTK